MENTPIPPGRKEGEDGRESGVSQTMCRGLPTSTKKIDARAFYGQFRGHPIRSLEVLLPALRTQGESSSADGRLIWTAGDSSLDNKYWFPDVLPALPGAYHDLMQPPLAKPDVTYWLNHFIQQEQQNSSASSSGTRIVGAINAAVEASTLNERSFALRAQDKIIVDHLQTEDVLVVSVGGNDIALLPSPCTACSILGMLALPTACLERGRSCGAAPCDDYCWGCGPSLCSCLCAYPPCLGYFRHMFGTRLEHYLRALTAKTRPNQILVCMIYYPDEANIPSWANTALGVLRYNQHPDRVQGVIRTVFNQATRQIRVPGTTVVPVPLFHVLDGKTSQDYIARVEPSPSGGRKMAEYILHLIAQHENFAHGAHDLSTLQTGAHSSDRLQAPTSTYMRERD